MVDGAGEAFNKELHGLQRNQEDINRCQITIITLKSFSSEAKIDMQFCLLEGREGARQRATVLSVNIKIKKDPTEMVKLVLRQTYFQDPMISCVDGRKVNLSPGTRETILSNRNAARGNRPVGGCMA